MILIENFNSRARLIFVVLLLSLSACTKNTPGLKNRVVVRVNSDSLSAENFSELLAARLKVFNVLSAKDSAVIAQAKNSVVQDFIVQVVTQDWAQSNQIFVRKEQLEEEVLRTQKSYPDSIAFRKALADEGLAYAQWESRVKHSVLERLVLEQLQKSIVAPTNDELKAYYTKNKERFQQTAAIKVRQIVSDSESSAQRIKKELVSGKTMASLAKKFSITAEASLGGLTGWIDKGTLEVFDSAFKMNVGQRSQIVKSPYGWHIFDVVEKRQAKAFGYDEVQARVKKALLSEREQLVYSSWLEEQVLKARVFKDDEFLKQITVQTRSTQ